MAFGFPAHPATQPVPIDARLRAAATAASRPPGRSGFGRVPQGARIVVARIGAHAPTATRRCALPLRCIDRARGRADVEGFIGALRRPG